MSATKTINKEPGIGNDGSSAPVSGQPTKALFSLMEDEAGGVTPEPSDITDFNREFVFSEISPKDYHSSNFPSLMSHLGPNARRKTNKQLKKIQQISDVHAMEDRDHEKVREKRHKKDLTFAQNMRRHNEAQWLRIEAVAKEKMDYYEKYVADMTLKLKQQRAKINQRTERLLRSLEREEEKKKEDKLYASPFGRMWRHHRSMQRRAFSLEPMRP